MVAGAANAIIAFAAFTAGAVATFAPLSAPVFLTFTVLGVLALMHAVVGAVGVPVYQRLAPVR